jgi:thioredoxin-like negative regulator of GroEL
MSNAFDRRQFFALAAIAASGSAMPALAAMPAGFRDYNKDTFPALLKGDKPVLVHVHADWCPVCVRQSKAFGELASNADLKKVVAVQVNFDMDKDFREAHKVNNQSVLIVFRGGKEVSRAGGISDSKQIAEFLAKALA